MTPLRLPLLLAAFSAALLQSGCIRATVSSETTAPPLGPTSPGIVSTHGRLQVAGSRVFGSHGRPVSLAGNSFFWSQWMGRFYTADTVAWLKEDWGATIVRAALGVHREDGYSQHPQENLARITTVADAAVANDLYVLIDWHDHHAHEHTEQAVAFFSAMARRYGHLPHVIYEIYNEPLADTSWPRDVKPYAERVIAAIRAVDPDNLIIVGSPNWAQDVDIAAADPIKDANVAYSLHFYAGTHKQALRSKAEKAMRLGAALFVTEWGTCNADGNGPIDEASVQEWMAFIRKHRLSHCNWAVSDKSETASIVRSGAASQGGWADADLTESGKFVRELIRNWRTQQIP